MVGGRHVRFVIRLLHEGGQLAFHVRADDVHPVLGDGIPLGLQGRDLIERGPIGTQILDGVGDGLLTFGIGDLAVQGLDQIHGL